MSVFIIFECCRHRDRVTEVVSTEELASVRLAQLDAAHPNSDGFYYEQYEVITEAP